MAQLLSLRRVSTALSLLLFAAVASALTVDFGPVVVFLGNSDMPGQATGHGTGPTGSTFTGPTGCAFDPSNNFYIADTSNHVLRRVGLGADIATVFAGNFNSSGDVEGTGGAARFGSPMDMQYSAASGNLFVADFAQHRIFQVTLAGAVTRYAGTGLSGLANGQGTSAEFNAPAFMALRPGTSDVEMWVTEQGSHRIRKLNNRNVGSFVGSESGLFGDTNGVGSVVRLRVPAGIVLDPAGTTLYLADSGNFKIKSITNPGGQVIQIAGGGSAGDVDGPGTSSRFRQPWGMVLDRQGRFLYIADKSANYVKRMELSSLVVDTVWGHDGAGWSVSPVSFGAQVASPAGLCMQYTSTYTRLFLTGSHSVAYASRRTTRSKTFSLFTSGPQIGGTPSPDGGSNPSSTTASPDGPQTPSAAPAVSLLMAFVALLALFVA